MVHDYRWIAYLDDGSSIAEYDAGSFTKVPAEHCIGVEVIPRRQGFPHLYVKVDPAAGQRAVFVRRHKLTVNLSGRPIAKAPIVHVVGFTCTDGSGAYQFVNGDGTVILSGDFGAA